MKIKYGCTRIVFIFKTTVWKIPNFKYSWEHFLKGLIGNMQERNMWRWNSGKYEEGNSHLLCPVLFAAWGGWLIIMPKADMQKHENEIRALPRDQAPPGYSSWKNIGFGGDDKVDNYGYLNGKLVKVDYGS